MSHMTVMLKMLDLGGSPHGQEIEKISKYTENKRSRVLIVGEGDTNRKRDTIWISPCGVKLELKVLVQTQVF